MKEAEMEHTEQKWFWRIISDYPYAVAMPITAILAWAVFFLMS